jgi:hypothetical protein
LSFSYTLINEDNMARTVCKSLGCRVAVLPQELLDAVLQHVDIKTLLFAQGVSHHWKETITSSPQIQELLFFRPKTTNLIYHKCNWLGNKLSHFGPATKPTETTVTTPTVSPLTTTFTSIVINPLLANEIYYENLDSGAIRWGQRIVLPHLDTFLHHPAGSWRSMLVTQPPIANVVAVSIDQGYAQSLRSDINFVEETCTLGSLVDRMLAAEQLDAESSEIAPCIWHVMYVNALDTESIAVGDWIAKYVDGKLVPTPARCTSFVLEKRKPRSA